MTFRSDKQWAQADISYQTPLGTARGRREEVIAGVLMSFIVEG